MLSDLELRRRLSRLLSARPTKADPSRREELARRLERRVAQLDEPEHVGGVRALVWVLATRLAVATAAFVALGVVACSLPTEVDVDLGLRVQLSFTDVDDPSAQLERLGVALEGMSRAGIERGPAAAGPHEVRVEVHARVVEIEDEAGAVTRRSEATVHLWAENLDEATVIDTIEAAAPAATVVDIEGVAGPVETTMGDRFAHELFDADLDEMDVEQARRRILADLEARGLADGAEVKVSDADGHRRVEVRVRD